MPVRPEEPKVAAALYALAAQELLDRRVAAGDDGQELRPFQRQALELEPLPNDLIRSALTCSTGVPREAARSEILTLAGGPDGSTEAPIGSSSLSP